MAALTSLDVANLVMDVRRGMARGADAQAMAMAKRALARRVSGDPRSPGSRSLSTLSGRHPGALSPRGDELLAGCEIVLVDLPWPNAVARCREGRTQIVVFDGLRRLIWSFGAMVTVLALLQDERGEARVSIDGLEVEEALLFSLAATSQLADFVRNGTTMVELDDLLAEVPRRNLEVGYGVGMLFVLLHEAGHGELGHLAGGTHGELAHAALVEPERLTGVQRDELAADAFAVACLSEGHRAGIVSNLIFTLGTFALLEAFSGGLSAAHPLAINRLAALADEAGLQGVEREVVTGWIGDRLRVFREMAGDRAAAGGSVADRIEKAMPATEARMILRRLKRRILRETGVLGTGMVP